MGVQKWMASLTWPTVLLVVLIVSTAQNNVAAVKLNSIVGGILRSTQARTSIVNLHNRSWDQVRVQVRMGNRVNPDENRLLGIFILRRGEFRSIPCEREDVWYRREKNPNNPDGEWTKWVHRPCYEGKPQTYDEYL